MKPFAIGAARLAALGYFTVTGCIPQPWLASAGIQKQAFMSFYVQSVMCSNLDFGGRPSIDEKMAWVSERLTGHTCAYRKLRPHPATFKSSF
jgi:hypothetical protein